MKHLMAQEMVATEVLEQAKNPHKVITAAIDGISESLFQASRGFQLVTAHRRDTHILLEAEMYCVTKWEAELYQTLLAAPNDSLLFLHTLEELRRINMVKYGGENEEISHINHNLNATDGLLPSASGDR